MRYAYSQMLADRYQLMFADNPLSALTEVATHRPDVVLLDINLKHARQSGQSTEATKVAKYMDGLDVCAAIKRSPYKDIPVILLTGRDGLIDKVRGRLAHADCYLTKPVTSEMLKEKIKEFLSPKIVANRLQGDAMLQTQPKSRLRR